MKQLIYMVDIVITNGKYIEPDLSDAKTIVDVISATLNSAGEVQGFSITNALNNIRRLNEMLGIIVQYPDDVEKIKIEEEKEKARIEVSKLKKQISELKAKKKEIEYQLAKLQRYIDEKNKIINGDEYGDGDGDRDR